MAPPSGKLISEVPISVGLKEAGKHPAPWRIAAGQELTPTQFHCATVGADEANEASRKINARHWREHNAKVQIQHHHAPVNVLGGYKFPGAPNIDLNPIATAPTPTPSAVVAVIGDGLDIPEFLRRR